MPSTVVTYAAMQYRPTRLLCNVRTHIAYDARRYAVLALLGTGISRDAMRCAVLTWRMVLCDVRYWHS
eukprot:3609542-Rhodomonas_salina.1